MSFRAYEVTDNNRNRFILVIRDSGEIRYRLGKNAMSFALVDFTDHPVDMELAVEEVKSTSESYQRASERLFALVKAYAKANIKEIKPWQPAIKGD